MDKGLRIGKDRISLEERARWAQRDPFAPEINLGKKYELSSEMTISEKAREYREAMGGFRCLQIAIAHAPEHFLSNPRTSWFTWEHLQKVGGELLNAFMGRELHLEPPISCKV